MLKKISRLFLGLVVCAGSACVTPTHASSADDDVGWLPDIVISRIQASGEFGAKDEYVVLHNNSNVQADITDWCLMNKNRIIFACFINQHGDATKNFYVPPYGDAVVASTHYANARSLPDSAYTIQYEVTNNSSGSIVNSGDHLILIDSAGWVVTQKIWDTAIPTGKVLSRMLVLPSPAIYATTSSPSDWLFEVQTALPTNSVITITHEYIDPETDTDPTSGGEVPPLENQPLHPIITEVLPNPAGSDTGKEFIELHNPNENIAISLDNYTILIGTTTIKSYAFPEASAIPPLGYVSFSNETMGYTLNNTEGKIQLAKNSEAIGWAVEYTSPKDDMAWALIDVKWQYTKPATPGAPNTLLSANDTPSASSTNTKPCAANQLRNPETGRCKLITAASAEPTPCKPNQARNPETNRCRNIATTTAPAPCKEGQERNPETKRCRNIVKMSTAGNAIDVQSKADGAMSWYYWAAIIAIIGLVVGYGVWEWRVELLALWSQLRMKFAKHPE